MITIACRSTKQGAMTYVIRNRHIVVTPHSTSGTGRHWSEDVEGKDGARCSVRDISNSGKHACWIGVISGDGYKVIQRAEEGRRCLICAIDCNRPTMEAL